MHARILVITLTAGLCLLVPSARAVADSDAAATTRELANLRAFAKLYGYVRFFHPSDAAAATDWDRFAIDGSAAVRDARSPEALAETLRELFLPIAPTMAVYEVDSRSLAPRVAIADSADDSDVVAWQHRGIGLESPSYKSVRTNRESDTAAGERFGQFAQAIDPAPWRGRNIRLRAAVRTDVSGEGNSGHLWLRVDRPNRQRGFFDNMQDRPITASQWSTYEISGVVDGDAERLIFGAFLNGEGRLWADDFELSVETEYGTWEPLPILNGSFEDSGKLPVGWFAAKDHYAFELVDADAFSGTYALSVRSDPPIVPGAIFDVVPPAGYSVDKPLGFGLRVYLPIALTDADAASPVAPRETRAASAGDEPTATNPDVRYAGVIIAWNVLQHFYPYFDVIEADWDQVLTGSLLDASDDRDAGDFDRTLGRMIAALEDGHGNSFHLDSGPGLVPLPFRMRWIQGRVVVTHASKGVGAQVGDVVLTIDGRSVHEIVEEDLRFLSGSVQWRLYRALQRLGKGPENTPVTLTVDRNGEALELTLLREASKPDLHSLQEIDTLRDGIRYVDLTRAAWPAIQAVVQDLAVAPGVIFDLRGYPNSNHDVLSHLTDEPIRSARWNQPLNVYPDQDPVAGWDRSGRWLMVPRAPRIEGKVVFLTDASAISYAESVMGIVEHYELAEIVGQRTAGANGAINFATLPGNFRFVFTGSKVLKHDGSQHHLVGIGPTVPVERTIEGVRNGVDEVLEVAIDLILARPNERS